MSIQFVPQRYVPLLPFVGGQYVAKMQPSINQGKMMLELQDGAYLETDIPDNWAWPWDNTTKTHTGEAVIDAQGVLVSFKPDEPAAPKKKPEPTGKSSPLKAGSSWKL